MESQYENYTREIAINDINDIAYLGKFADCKYLIEKFSINLNDFYYSNIDWSPYKEYYMRKAEPSNCLKRPWEIGFDAYNLFRFAVMHNNSDFCVWFIARYKIEEKNVKECFVYTIEKNKVKCMIAVSQFIIKPNFNQDNINHGTFYIVECLKYASKNSNFKTFKWLSNFFGSGVISHCGYDIFINACMVKNNSQICNYIAVKCKLKLSKILDWYSTDPYGRHEYALLLDMSRKSDADTCKWFINFFNIKIEDVIGENLVKAFN